jgi:DNA-binding FrmR family transcriptional regulator
MPHTIRGKKQLLTRVRRIRGQTEALEKALEQETECAVVLQQIAAIRGAVNGLMVEVLEGHIREHLGPEAVHRNSGVRIWSRWLVCCALTSSRCCEA